VSRSETIDTGNLGDCRYPSMNTIAKFSAVSLASSTGIYHACFVSRSMIVATALFPVSDVGSLVTKSMFILSVRSRGIGSAFSRPYGLACLCLTRWHVSHPATHSVTESVIFSHWYRALTAAAVFATPLCLLPRIAPCASRKMSALNDLRMHNFPPDGLWYRRPLRAYWTLLVRFYGGPVLRSSFFFPFHPWCCCSGRTRPA